MDNSSRLYTSSGVSVTSYTRNYTYIDGKCIITMPPDPHIDTIYLDNEGKITRGATYLDGTNKISNFGPHQYFWSGDNMTMQVLDDTTMYTYLTTKNATMADPTTIGNYLQYGRALWTNKNLVSGFSGHSLGGGSQSNHTIDYTFDGSGRVSTAVVTGTSSGTSSNSVKSFYTFNY